ncbi:MAG: DUF5317 domain-containing protein [Chitinophagales bacterium]
MYSPRGVVWIAVSGLLSVVARIATAWGGPLGRIPYVVSLACLVAWTLLNRNTPGMPLATLGLSLNTLVIAVNGGAMPVLAGSDLVSSRPIQSLTHVSIGESRALWFLGDVLRLNTPFRHSFLISPGDVLLSLGVFLCVQYLVAPSRDSR